MPSLPPEIALKIIHISSAYSTTRWINYLMKGFLLPDPAVQCFHPNTFIEIRPYDWIQLTHVCHTWREVALSTSSLWTHIAVFRKEAVAEIIKRAQDQPVLTVSCSDGSHSRLLQRILPDIIGRVSLAIIPALPSIITEDYARKATQLKNLVFVDPGHPSNALGPPHHPNAPLAFPVLQHLENVSTIWASFAHLISRTLTTLILQRPGVPYDEEDADSAGYAHPAHVLATALLHTPSLEVLDVHVDDHTQVITVLPALPRLRRLGIRGATIPCVALYNALQIPRNVRINLDCRSSLETVRAPLAAAPGEIAALIANSKQPSADRPKFEPISSFSIHGSLTEYRMLGWRSSHSLDEVLSLREPDVEFTIPTKSFASHVRTMMSAFPLCRPQICRLGSLPYELDPSVANIGHVIAALETPTTLIFDSAAPNIVCEITADTPASRLFLSNMKFDEDRPNAHEQYQDVEYLEFGDYGAFADFVAACSFRERLFEEMTLRRMTHFTAEHASQLRDVVKKLIWDGVVRQPIRYAPDSLEALIAKFTEDWGL